MLSVALGVAMGVAIGVTLGVTLDVMLGVALSTQIYRWGAAVNWKYCLYALSKEVSDI